MLDSAPAGVLVKNTQPNDILLMKDPFPPPADLHKPAEGPCSVSHALLAGRLPEGGLPAGFEVSQSGTGFAPTPKAYSLPLGLKCQILCLLHRPAFLFLTRLCYRGVSMNYVGVGAVKYSDKETGVNQEAQ